MGRLALCIKAAGQSGLVFVCDFVSSNLLIALRRAMDVAIKYMHTASLSADMLSAEFDREIKVNKK